MFNPNHSLIQNGNMFGFPFLDTPHQLEIIPSCIDITASGKKGTAQAPLLMLESSLQLDFHHPLTNIKLWEKGIKLLPFNKKILKDNAHFSKQSSYLINKQEKNIELSSKDIKLLEDINKYSQQIIDENRQLATQIINRNNLPALIGGDHSNSLGVVQALSKKYKHFGILQLDAHADLREAYEGFKYSHASVAYEYLKIKNISHLIQIGLRDVSPQEMDVIKNEKRIYPFFSRDIKKDLYVGSTWEKICEKMITILPQNIYITYDIDVLNPSLCPNTGTPVPGGFDFEQITYLLWLLKKYNKQIIGFDLCEVGNHKYDTNIGARVLWELANLTVACNAP